MLDTTSLYLRNEALLRLYQFSVARLTYLGLIDFHQLLLLLRSPRRLRLRHGDAILIHERHVTMNDELATHIVADLFNLGQYCWLRNKPIVQGLLLPGVIQPASISRQYFFKAALCTGLFGRRIDDRKVNMYTLSLPRLRVDRDLILVWYNNYIVYLGE
jgi:hypothetical protein